jgi:hypothetical protein
VSAEAAASSGKGPQAAISAPITEMPLGTYSFSIRERFLFRGSLGLPLQPQTISFHLV